MKAVSLPAPKPDKSQFQYKKIAVVLLDQYSSNGSSRLHLELRLPRPAWGTLNVTGPVTAWSFTDSLPSSLSLPVRSWELRHVTVRTASREQI